MLDTTKPVRLTREALELEVPPTNREGFENGEVISINGDAVLVYFRKRGCSSIWSLELLENQK